MKKSHSIKAILTTRLLIGLFICYAVLGAVFYKVVEVSLTDQFDNELVSWVNNITELFDFEEPDMDSEFHGTAFDNEDFPGNRKYYQVRTRDKKTIAQSLSLNNFDLPALEVDLDQYRFENIPLPDNISGRAVAFTFINRRLDESALDEPTLLKLQDFVEKMEKKAATDPITENDLKRYYAFLSEHGIEETTSELTIVLAQSRQWLDQILVLLQFSLFGLGIMLIAVSWIIVRLSVKRGLVPLNTIADKIEKIRFDDLEQRFSDGKIPEELMPVISKLDEMLERLDTAFTREKRFTANAAHELRTPIAELRALAEVGRDENFTDENDIKDYFSDALDIAVQMQTLTESLLTLARIDSNRLRINREPVDLSSLVGDVLTKADKTKGDRRFKYSMTAPAPPLVVSDKPLLFTIVSNLISNAVHYSPDKTDIYISLNKKNQGLSLSVSNLTTDLTEKDLPSLFEPFWRKDPARSDLSRTGVGLTLVKSCCDLLNISIETTLQDTGYIVFSLFIPEN